MGTNQKRTEKIVVRATPSEKNAYASQAKSFGISLSNFIRQSLSRVNPWSPEDLAHKRNVRRHLSQINNNLNQIAKKLNQDASIPVLTELASIREMLANFYAD